jgi:hypothetical protein
MKSDVVTAANVDNHVLGIGGRVYFDTVINEKFSINLYGEFMGYPVKQDLFKSGIQGPSARYLAKSKIVEKNAMLSPILGDMVIVESGTVNYGYDLTFEAEPSFSTSLREGITFTAGLPFNFNIKPGAKYDITLTDDFKNWTASRFVLDLIPNNPELETLEKDTKRLLEEGLNGDTSFVFSLKPGVSFFFTGWALPTEFKISYSLPVAGVNATGLHSLTFQTRLYFGRR